MKWERWHAWALGGVVAIAAVIAFKKCDGSSTTTTTIDEPKVVVPEDLLCDLYVAAPNTSWGKLQRGVGGAVGILPANLPGVVIALTDLDPQLAVELDGTLPMYGAVAGDVADPSYVFAMKFVDPRRARVMLVNNDAGKYTASDGGAGLTALAQNRPSNAASPRHEIAISPNGYLLIGKHAADLVRLGPYVTRSLPARPLPGDSAAVIEIPRSALSTKLKPKLDSFWKDGKSFLLGQDERMRAERGGRPPDFGDPVAIVAALDAVLGRRVAILGDLERVRVALDITEDASILTATLTPAAGAVTPLPSEDKTNGAGAGAAAAKKWIETMRTGDSAAVLAFPATAALALSTRDGDAERAEQSAAFEKAVVSALGQRLKEPEKLHEMMEAVTKARDESFALSVGLEDPPGVLLRAPVRDGEAAQKAIRSAIDLTKSDPFKELLRVRDITTTSDELVGLGKVSIATLVPQPQTKRDAPSSPPPLQRPNEAPLRRAQDGGAPTAAPATHPTKHGGALGLAYIVDPPAGAGTLIAGGGSEPLVTLKVGAKPDRKLSDEPSLKRFTSAIGNDASTILIAQPLRLDPKRANLPTAPIGVAVGKKGSDAFVRVDISDGLLREAARWQMGF